MQPPLAPAQAPAVPSPPEVPVAPVAAAASPVAEAGPADVTGAAGAVAAPRTASDVVAIQARTTELREQLRAAQARRVDVARAIRRADPVEGNILEGRIAALDTRVAELRVGIARGEQAIAGAPAAALTIARPHRGFLLLGSDGPSPNAIPALLLAVLALQVLLLRRGRGGRRATVASDAMLRDASARLARVEEAVDAIAVEVERVSEGQRFVSRLLGERPPVPGTAAASPPRQYATPT